MTTEMITLSLLTYAGRPINVCGSFTYVRFFLSKSYRSDSKCFRLLLRSDLTVVDNLPPQEFVQRSRILVRLISLRGEETIAELCRREGIAQSIYYKWSKEFLEAGKRRLAGDTARSASTGEVKALRQEARELKEVVAEQTLELRLLKKSMIADGGDDE